MSEVDLHTHTTASDGLLTPSQLVEAAVQRGIKALAITDHDSTEGIAEALTAAKAHEGFTVIPGVEMSTDVPHGEIHIVGLFVDYTNTWFQEILVRLRESRVGRAERMVEKLAALGVKVDWERVQEIAGSGSVGRPHIAQAMLEKGYVSSFQEAFQKYIGREGPAYADRYKLTPMEAVEMLMKAEALPVLAHPADIVNLDEILSDLKIAGLAGIETNYTGYSPEIAAKLQGIAKAHGLIPSGGSDFHGFTVVGLSDLGGVDVPMESVIRFTSLAAQRKKQ